MVKILTIYIYMPITSFDGPLLASKSQEAEERRENKARKRKDEKDDKTLKREKPPHLVWGFFWALFYYKTGEN